jgi:hypothetical protein
MELGTRAQQSPSGSRPEAMHWTGYAHQTAAQLGKELEQERRRAVMAEDAIRELRAALDHAATAYKDALRLATNAQEREQRRMEELAQVREEFRQYSEWAQKELAHAKDAEAEALVRAGEAAERAWEASVKLDTLVPRAARRVLEKNARTIKRLRKERHRWADVASYWREVALEHYLSACARRT